MSPTPYPNVNELLGELLPRIQQILGPRFIGMYLDGSLATGGFDDDSDIDFVVVTDTDIRSENFAALQTMHDQIAWIDSPPGDEY